MARSITTRSTNPKIMDDNIKILDDALSIVSAPPAEDVVYDNTDSGLTAEDVQAAIDELAGITVLATSTGSKTNAEHILALKPTWDLLTKDQRLKCKLVRGTLIYQCIETGSAGRFACALIDNQKFYVEMIRISNQTYGYFDGTTYTDMSNQTATDTYQLVI